MYLMNCIELFKEDDNIRFWIPPEDENVGAIIGIKGKEKKYY